MRERDREKGSIKEVRAAWGPRTATKCTLYLKLDTWLIRPVLLAAVDSNQAHLLKYCTEVQIQGA